MILMYPFEDKKEKIRVQCQYELVDSFLRVVFLVEDSGLELEDFYPFENVTDLQGSLFPLENLWTTTCFEIFLKNKDADDYYEMNFNSKGEWNIFYFSKYRERVSSYKPNLNVRMTTQKFGDRLRLDYVFSVKKIEKLKLPCQVNLAAITKTQVGCSYWSQKHTSSKADFHEPKNFSLIL